MSRSSRELIQHLGPNLTKVFGLATLPPSLDFGYSYETISPNNKPIYTEVHPNRLVISDDHSEISDARFSIYADQDGPGTFIRYALYSRLDKWHRPHLDFQHHAEEFMFNSFQYLASVLTVPFLGIIADWKHGESHFNAFEKEYESTRDLLKSVRATWAGSIIMNRFKFPFVTASVHALENLKNRESIDVYFTAKKLELPY